MRAVTLIAVTLLLAIPSSAVVLKNGGGGVRTHTVTIIAASWVDNGLRLQRAGADLILRDFACVATGSQAPILQLFNSVICDANAANCSSAGLAALIASETTAGGLDVGNHPVSNGGWFGFQMITSIVAASAVHCTVEYAVQG